MGENILIYYGAPISYRLNECQSNFRREGEEDVLQPERVDLSHPRFVWGRISFGSTYIYYKKCWRILFRKKKMISDWNLYLHKRGKSTGNTSQESCRQSIVIPHFRDEKNQDSESHRTEYQTWGSKPKSFSLHTLLHFHIPADRIGYFPIPYELVFSHFGWRLNHDHNKSQKKNNFFISLRCVSLEMSRKYG